MIAREICRRASPETFKNHHVCDNRNHPDLLKKTMDDVNVDGINVILTPGRYNAAFFEHSYLAEKSGAVLVSGQDLEKTCLSAICNLNKFPQNMIRKELCKLENRLNRTKKIQYDGEILSDLIGIVSDDMIKYNMAIIKLENLVKI